MELANKCLVFLECCCEGHYSDMQEFIRTQPNMRTQVNLVIDMVNSLLVLERVPVALPTLCSCSCSCSCSYSYSCFCFCFSCCCCSRSCSCSCFCSSYPIFCFCF